MSLVTRKQYGNGNYFAFEGWVEAKTNKPYRDMEPAEHHAHMKKIYDVVLKTLGQ